MQTKAEITAFQFYTILFLSRIFSLVTYISGIRDVLSTSAEILSVVIMSAILFISVIPAALLLKKDNGTSILTRAECISPSFSKLLCVIYLMFFIYKGITTASRFELLLGSVMFPETNVQFFVAILLVAAVFCALRGIEALGRASVIFLVPVLFAFGFVFLSLADDFDILNLSAIYKNEAKGILDGAVYSASRTNEAAVIPLMIPFVKRHRSKHLFIWTGVISAIIILTEVMISGVLGGFGENQLFNMYSLSVIAKLGFIERMDAIISCIWMICSALKLALTFFVCNILLSSLTDKSRPKLYITLSAAVVFAGMMVISLSIVSFAQLIRIPLMTIFYTATAIVIPLIIIFAEKSKEKKHEKA